MKTVIMMIFKQIPQHPFVTKIYMVRRRSFVVILLHFLGYSPMTPGSSSNASSPYHPSTPSRGGGGDSDILAGQDWYSPDIEVNTI